jgi:hypothetical protein
MQQYPATSSEAHSSTHAHAMLHSWHVCVYVCISRWGPGVVLWDICGITDSVLALEFARKQG